MTRYKIEKGVPIPESNAQYPWKEMEVGDSFTVPIEKKRRLESARYAWGKRYGKKFTVKAEGDKARIWRIE